MKILTGKFKGRAFPMKPHPALRPTSDKARKALVDVLAECIPDSRVLDLYAGTGAVGLEMLSGGARQVLFVEKDTHQAASIQAVCRKLGTAHEVRVRVQDVHKALRELEGEGMVFDIIFADPPYASGDGALLAARIDATGLLAPGGWFVLERALRDSQPGSDFGSLIFKVQKSYGDSQFLFFQKKELI